MARVRLDGMAETEVVMMKETASIKVVNNFMMPMIEIMVAVAVAVAVAVWCFVLMVRGANNE